VIPDVSEGEEFVVEHEEKKKRRRKRRKRVGRFLEHLERRTEVSVASMASSAG
jgi:hypothetical protein